MKFNNKLIFLLSLVASTTVLAEGASVSVSYRANQSVFRNGGQVAQIHVTSDEDLLKIEDIIVNRGNCVIRPSVDDVFNGKKTANKKRTLKYGQTVLYELNDCNVREIILETNYGTQTFTQK